MIRMTRCLVRCALVVPLLAGALSIAAAQPARPRAPAPVVNVTVPDSMKVSAHLNGPITVNNADPSPWWDSNMFSAFLGALVGGLLAVMTQAAGARLAFGLRHRNSLARLERVCIDVLNEIISDKRNCGEAKAAAEKAAVFWHPPNRFDIDRSFTMDIIDMPLVNLVGALNTDLTRYNHDLEHLGRARESLQSAYLAGTLPQGDWEKAMHMEVTPWDAIAKHLDAVDDMVRDVRTRAVLLVWQYDSRRARFLRSFGLGILRTWPLKNDAVVKERREFDAQRKAMLEADQKRLDGLHGGAGSAGSKP